MTAAVQAQLNAHKAAPPAPRPASGTGVASAAGKAVAGAKPGRDTAKELPGPRADTPVRWQVAGGLFAEQFGGCFRVVVSGHEKDLPAVLAALTELTR